MSVWVLPLCGPVGKITIDFLFVPYQLGLSGPFIGSIISAHYRAHTVAHQWGNESRSLQWAWVAKHMHVYLSCRRPIYKFVCLAKIGRRIFFMSLWSISTINQNIETLRARVCVCPQAIKRENWRQKIENKTWTENWICASNCEHKSSGGK